MWIQLYIVKSIAPSGGESPGYLLEFLASPDFSITEVPSDDALVWNKTQQNYPTKQTNRQKNPQVSKQVVQFIITN